MCGIVGIHNFNNNDVKKELISVMNNSIIHRGPDSGSIFIEGNIALGHRRLKIIDLSDAANQPFYSENGNFVIVFNGEIYNFWELRARLEQKGISFHTNSDTEVILAYYIELGEGCFDLFEGMFAIAIYDKVKQSLIIARDRFGIKPLYFVKNKDYFAFGSEIKALLTLPDIDFSISQQALSEYMWFGNPLGNNTFYESIKEIEPGHIFKVNKDKIEITNYCKEFEGSIKEKSIEKIKEETLNLLETSIQLHLTSDVPVGIFLSGGIDSSAITAIASKFYHGQLKTFSVEFEGSSSTELPTARKIAKQFKTEHSEIKISYDNLKHVIEKLIDSHDEPFADAANIPLYLLSQKVMHEVKVVLQGDGGDEIFGGYTRYNTIQKIAFWSRFKWLVNFPGTNKITNSKFLRLKRFVNAISEKDEARRNALLLTVETEYDNPINYLSEGFRKGLADCDPFKRYKEVYQNLSTNLSPSQKLFISDQKIILKDTFLEKVDKSTMANSIEVRVPFISKQLIEYVNKIPAEVKVKDGEQKAFLKSILRGIVPNEVLDSRKKGFGVPYGNWLKTGLKDYFLEQINHPVAGEIIDVNKVNDLFKLHLKNKGHHDFLLWKIMTLCSWYIKLKGRK